MADKQTITTIGFLKAANTGEMATLVKYLEQGGNVNVCNIEGNTALLLAIRGGHSDAAQLLLRCGADVSPKNRYGDDVTTLAMLAWMKTK